MAQVIGGITCQEIVYDYEETASRSEGIGSTKKFLCNWADRYTVANTMIGVNVATGILSPGTIFNTAVRHPESPNMLVSSVAIRGAGTPTQGAQQLQFPYAVITASYSVPTWAASEPSDDPTGQFAIDGSAKFVYCTQRLSAATEMISMPGWGLKFDDGTLLKDGRYAYASRNVRVLITFYKIPYFRGLANAGINLANYANNAVFLGQPTGTVMYEGAETDIEYFSNGTRAINVTYSFLIRCLRTTATGPRLRWDEEISPNDGTKHQVQCAATGLPLVFTADLTQLWPGNYQY